MRPASVTDQQAVALGGHVAVTSRLQESLAALPPMRLAGGIRIVNIRHGVSQSRSDKSKFYAQLRYKLKTGQFIEAILEGEPLLDAEQKVTGMVFYLEVDHAL